MKVPYDEGVASHVGPESCVDDRKVGGEALTGEVRAGLLSLENLILRSADVVMTGGRQQRMSRHARGIRTPRGLRPCARIDAPHKEGQPLRSEAGRSQARPVHRHRSVT